MVMTAFAKRLLLLLLALVLPATPLIAASEATGGTAGRWIVDRSNDGDTVISVLIYYDMEGLSGQSIITSIDFPRPEYFEARELLTADVNAVIDGFFAGGADSVMVVDAHGSFNPEPDILLDKMDSRAHMLYRNAKFDPYVGLAETDHYDAVAAVGMHSRTGGGGFAEHTVNVGAEWILNGMPLNESEILAYSWGRQGVPLILVSGDDKLAEQCAWMDWMKFVTVKKAVAIDSVVLRPVDQVHGEMRTAAKEAVQQLDRMKAVRLTEPVTARLHEIPPGDLSILENVPGVDYSDQAVTFQAANFKEAYAGMRALLDAAQYGYLNIAAGMFLGQGQDAFAQFKDAVLKSWIETAKEAAVAADTTAQQKREPPTATEPEKPQKFFGSK